MSVGPQLDVLEASGLIRLAAVRPELLYLFRHWLVQDAAYSSLLKQERRDLHRLVGEALERLYPQARDEYAAELALHFERAEVREKAVHYLIAAGQFALERFAREEATSFYERAAALIPQDDDSHWQRERVQIAIGRMASGFSMRTFDEQVGVGEAAIPAAEAAGDLGLLLDLYLAVALIRLQRGERYETSPGLKRALDRASEIGTEQGNPAAAAWPMALTGMAQVRAGQLRAGIAALEAALPALEQRHAFIGASMAADTLVLGYARMGNFGRAREVAEQALRLAEGGDPIARLDAEIVLANLESMSGNLEQAETRAQACVARSDELGSPSCAVFSRWILGDVQLRRGQPEQAKPTLERGDVLAFGAAFVKPLVEAWLGSAIAELGDLDGARQAWQGAIRQSAQVHDRFSEAAIRLRRAATLAEQANPDWNAMLTDTDFSVQVFDESEARPFLAEALDVHARALAELGRRDESRVAHERAQQVRASMAAPAPVVAEP